MSARGLLFAVVAPPATLVFSAVSLLGGLLRAPGALHDWGHRTWSRALLAAAGVEVRLQDGGRLREGGQVLACNHQSLFDIPALIAAAPVSARFVAKEELSRVPVFAGAMRSAGHVFIDRGNPRSAISSMRDFGARMREEGLSIVVFPEGTRSPDSRLRRFKRAPFLLAIEGGVPVVPVAVEGGGRILPKGELLPRPGRITIRVGREVPTDSLAPEDRTDLAERVQDRVADLLGEIRRSG